MVLNKPKHDAYPMNYSRFPWTDYFDERLRFPRNLKNVVRQKRPRRTRVFPSSDIMGYACRRSVDGCTVAVERSLAQVSQFAPSLNVLTTRPVFLPVLLLACIMLARGVFAFILPVSGIHSWYSRSCASCAYRFLHHGFTHRCLFCLL